MASPLRVLLVEDFEDDALLILRELSRGGYEPSHRRVDTAAAMRLVLDAEPWDVVISDYSMPQFTGIAALELLASRGLDIPFIIVSGAIGEETAVAAMKAGAHDYVMKSSLGRLVPAVRRELRDAEIRRARRRSESALHEAHRRLQALSSRMMQIQETERRTIAHELHDEIGQALTAVKINLQTLLLRAGTGPGAGPVRESIAIVEQALEQVRGLSLDLRPPQLDDLGLPAAMRWYLDRQSRASGLEVQFECAVLPDRLPPDIETACFRIMQEAVTNVLRHAGATSLRVALRLRGAELELVVEDNGKGFDAAAAQRRATAGASLGLIGMQERAGLIGGRVEWSSTPGRGTRVEAGVPVSRMTGETAQPAAARAGE
ncbi:MAG: response regulator [Betaproteobacteria bacterium]|nr:response regulator [Betaproteobacteria bacterium]